MGDIGEGQKEYEFEPFPQEAPVPEPTPYEPDPVPEPAPYEPEETPVEEPEKVPA